MKKVLPWLLVAGLFLGGCSISLRGKGTDDSSSSSSSKTSQSSSKKKTSSSSKSSSSSSSSSSEEAVEKTSSFLKEGEDEGIKFKNQLNITYKGDTYTKIEIDSTYYPTEEMKGIISQVPYEEANAKLMESFNNDSVKKLSQVSGVTVDNHLEQGSLEIKSKITFDITTLDKASLAAIDDYSFITDMLNERPAKMVLMLSLAGYKEITQENKV